MSVVKTPLSATLGARGNKWVPDHSYDSCFGCLRKFNMFNRRHHCRLCGQLFCKSCSSSRVELSPEQGFVRVCDSCHQKQRRGSVSSARIGFNGTVRKTAIPLPKSIFSGLTELAGHVVMVAEFDNDPPITSSCRLTRTLACTCYESVCQSSTTQLQAVQSGHWTFDETRRLRLDLQFQAQGSVLFSARLHTSTGIFVGAGHVVIQSADLGKTSDTDSATLDSPGHTPIALGLVDHLQVDLKDIKSDRTIRMAGSLAWKLNRPPSGGAMLDEIKVGGSSRVALLTVVESEILDALSGINEAQEKESSRRHTITHAMSSSTRGGHETDRLTVDSTNTHRRSTMYEPVEDIMSVRTQLQVKADQLRLMKECIIKANESVQNGECNDNVPFSCMCFHCFGTVIV